MDWTTSKILIGMPPKGSAYPKRDAATMTFYASLAASFSDKDVVLTSKQYAPSVWVRDFMPIASDNKYLRFEPCLDYIGPNERRRYATFSPVRIFRDMLPTVRFEHVELKLDGGNVMLNSKYVIVSEKVLANNNPKTGAEIELLLARAFNGRTPVFARTEQEDKTGHVDGLLRFLH